MWTDILKLKQIVTPSTRISQRKEPTEEDGPTCLELYEKAVAEIKDYLSNYTSEMVRYSAGDYPWAEVQSEDTRGGDEFLYYTILGNVDHAAYFRYRPFLSEKTTENMACAFLEARGKVGHNILDGVKIWSIRSYHGDDAVMIRYDTPTKFYPYSNSSSSHISWFIQFKPVGDKVRGYGTKGELVMTEINNIVNDIMERHNNMR